MINNLIEILKKETENLTRLLEISEKVHEATVSGKIENIEGTLHKQEQIISELNTLEKNRLEVFSKLRRQLNNQNLTKVSEIIEIAGSRIPQPLLQELLEVDELLREKIVSVQVINEQNRFLISHSRNFLKDVLSLLVTDKSKSLLDRRG